MIDYKTQICLISYTSCDHSPKSRMPHDFKLIRFNIFYFTINVWLRPDDLCFFNFLPER
jgi:hypothetical protein